MPDDWIPIVALPNLDARGRVECECAAIVPPDDERVEKLRADHPRLGAFLSKFRGQFGNQIYPSLILLHKDAPPSCKTPEAITGLRDVLAMSVVPYARAYRLAHNQSNGLAFSTAFQLYPWMLDNRYEEMICYNAAVAHLHSLDEFRGQSFPEQGCMTVMERDIDLPLAKSLLGRWMSRFAAQDVSWIDKALFRSLNMATEASGLPALTASTFYDVGRSVALWVSAYEIAVHPESGISNKTRVAAELEKTAWFDNALAAADYPGPGNPPQQKQLATWAAYKIYGLRDDFLHGNDVDGPALLLNGKPIIDFAACVYRFILANILDLNFSEVLVEGANAEEIGKHLARKMSFERYQKRYERALLMAIA